MPQFTLFNFHIILLSVLLEGKQTCVIIFASSPREFFCPFGSDFCIAPSAKECQMAECQLRLAPPVLAHAFSPS